MSIASWLGAEVACFANFQSYKCLISPTNVIVVVTEGSRLCDPVSGSEFSISHAIAAGI